MFVDGMCALRTAELHVHFIHPSEKKDSAHVSATDMKRYRHKNICRHK